MMRAHGGRALASPMALVLLSTGYGATERGAGGPVGRAPSGFPVTVANCGVTTTYQRPPQRAVSLNQHATEVMLALGLEGAMAGTGYLDDKVLPEFRP